MSVPLTPKKVDAIIVGSGQAGTPLAFHLAAQGKNVVFIEKEKSGGTCVNTGCTPTKTYVASARTMWEAQRAATMGIAVSGNITADLKRIKKRKDKLLKSIVDGIQKGIKKEENITFIQGEAVFTDKKTLSVNGKAYTAEHIYLNVGARAYVPEVFKEVPFLTNTGILELEELPKHLIIIGGSYVGLEFGQMFRRFGCKVTIIERGDAIISKEDTATSAGIQEFMEVEGVVFKTKTTCTAAKKNKNGSITLTLKSTKKQEQLTGSHVLIAVGRTPNTDRLQLEKTGLTTDAKGYIPVNDELETKVKGVFALGDCNGKGAFTHTAYNDFEIIAHNLKHTKKRKVSQRILTYGLFVDPPLGRAGLTKKEALKEGYEVLESVMQMKVIARAKEKGETHGFMQVLVDAKTEKILGAAILGTGGDEVITSILNVMYAKKPFTLIRDSVVLHPTVSELLPTLMHSLKKVKP